MSEIISVYPRDCYDTCSMVYKVIDGKVVSVRGDRNHPITQGYILT